VKRHINTQLIYPPIDGSVNVLLAGSETNLAERVRHVDDAKSGLGALEVEHPLAAVSSHPSR
jgi:hypothetical protein